MKYRRDVIVKHGCFIGENDDYPQVTLVKVYRMQGVILAIGILDTYGKFPEEKVKENIISNTIQKK